MINIKLFVVIEAVTTRILRTTILPAKFGKVKSKFGKVIQFIKPSNSSNILLFEGLDGLVNRMNVSDVL